MYKFKINTNRFLRVEVTGYHHQYYTGHRQQGNPDFLNTLKNTFANEIKMNLIDARNKVVDIIKRDIPQIMKKQNITSCVFVCVPRAKALNTYSDSQLMFKKAVSIAANQLHNVIDGTHYIERVINTYTTHLSNATMIINDGDKPYPGITAATCTINKDKIREQNIILIDDIYTRTVNIDEDCIQALINNGAKKVIFYSIGYTRRNQ